MEITLEKIELVKDRTGVTYKEAKEALERSNGSVVEAIIDIEENIEKLTYGISDEKSKLIDNVKAIVQKGNVSKILVRDGEGNVVLNIPVNVGLLGAVFAPWAMLAGGIAAFSFKYAIEVIKDDGTVIDISDKTNEAIEKATEKGNEMYEKVKNSETYEKMREKTEETVGKATEAFKNKFAKNEEDEIVEEFEEDFVLGDEDDNLDTIDNLEEKIEDIIEETK